LKDFYAHSPKDQPIEKWETMREHEEFTLGKYSNGGEYEN
jgi:hypothetical protein